MDIEEISHHAKIGGRWLTEQLSKNGEWKVDKGFNIDAYYKAPWALAQVGYSREAQLILDHIRDNFLTPAGDLKPVSSNVLKEIQHLYANSYVLLGSMMTGRYEVGFPVGEFFETRIQTDGSFSSERGKSVENSGSSTMSTSAGGLAALALADTRSAKMAGDHLKKIRDKQPEPGNKFYTSLQGDGSLITDIDSIENSWFYLVEVDDPDQCWYSMGLPMAFLVQLYKATSESKYLELAEWFYDFQSNCVNPWVGGSSGKAGWGSSMLYQLTRDEKYRQTALEVAEYLISRQNNDGQWLPQSAEPDDELTEIHFDTTSEFTLWCDLIQSNLQH